MFGKKKKEEKKTGDWEWVDDPWHGGEMPAEQPSGHFYRGFELNDEQWERLVEGVKDHKSPSELEKDAQMMTDETKRRIQREAGIRGVVTPPSVQTWRGGSGEIWTPGLELSITGSPNGLHWKAPVDTVFNGIDVDALWEKMYEKFKKVIVICPWCHAPQAINDGTCIHCGGVLEIP
jgi:hypothetical protein